jgi:hypothetical protein
MALVIGMLVLGVLWALMVWIGSQYGWWYEAERGRRRP